MEKPVKNKLILSIGSNVLDKRERVSNAIDFVSGISEVVSSSEIYDTPECHGKDYIYANAVVLVITELSQEQFDSLLKEYEKKCGRDDEARRLENVPVDIDIVIVNDTIVRPRDYNRSFFKKGYDQLIGVV